MTNDRITELAKQCGFHSAGILHIYGGHVDALCDSEIRELEAIHRFAALVRAEALDEAKEVCRQVVRETNTTLTWEGCNEIQEALEREKT